MGEDPELRRRIELAESLGRAPKVLDGWTPRTFYEYDAAGRMVSSVPESEWDETEVEWMLALQRWRAETLCSLCGYPTEVCQAPYGTFVYGAEAPVRCNITDALRSAQHDAKGARNPGALIWRPKVQPWGSPE